MDKKIKSVKTKSYYQYGFRVIPTGTPGRKNNVGNWEWEKDSNSIISCDEIYIKNNPDFFEIEYKDEPETKSITVKIEYESWENDTELTVELIWEGLKDLYFKNAAVNVRKI